MTWDEAVKRVEELATLMAASPGDDDRVYSAALWLLLSHAIPREDRERTLRFYASAVCACSTVEDAEHAVAEMRHLLKLEVEP